MDYSGIMNLLEFILKHWAERIITLLPNFIVAVLILISCKVFMQYFRKLILHVFERFFPQYADMQIYVMRVAGYILWMVALVLVLNILELTSFVTHILAGAGILGIIAGFALKDLASNAFAGLLIRSRQPFRLGEWVEIDQYLGTVEDLGLICTGIRLYDGRMAFIPNQQIFSQSFLNYSRYGKMRIIVPVGVSYGDNLDKVEKIALEVARNISSNINPDTTDFYFETIGSSTYNFKVRFWIRFHEHVDILKAQSETIKALKARFEQEDIDVAYNVMTLDFGVKGGVNLYDNPVKIQSNGKDNA